MSFEDFSDGVFVFIKRGKAYNTLRHLKWRDSRFFPQKLDNLAFKRGGIRRGFPRHHAGDNALAVFCVRHADNECFADESAFGEMPFHMRGIDVLTAAFYQILRAVYEIETVSFVHIPEVAGTEPAVREDLGGFFRFSVIPLHNLRSAHRDFSNVVGAGVKNLHLCAGENGADQGAAGGGDSPRIRRHRERDNRRSFRQPIPLYNRGASNLRELFAYPRVNRSGAADAEFERLEVVRAHHFLVRNERMVQAVYPGANSSSMPFNASNVLFRL